MILLADFKKCFENHITENKAQTLQEATDVANEFFLTHKHIFQKSSQGATFKRNFYNEKNTSRFDNSSSNVNTNSNKSHKQNNPGIFNYTSKVSSQKSCSTESNTRQNTFCILCLL